MEKTMKITVDTKQDHPDEIKRAISFLQQHLRERGHSVEDNSNTGFMNPFADETPSEPQQDNIEPGFMNIFGDDNQSTPTESSDSTPTPESTDVLGNFFGENSSTVIPDEPENTETEEKNEPRPRFSLFDLVTYDH